MDKDAFVQSYGRIVAKSWTDPAFLGQLQSAPATVLQSEGLDVGSDVRVAVGVVEPTGRGTVDDQWDEFQKGVSSGALTLWIPEKPESVAGAVTADDDSISCTCTPCTTCT